MHAAVSIKYRRVTDGRTDIGHSSIYALEWRRAVKIKYDYRYTD